MISFLLLLLPFAAAAPQGELIKSLPNLVEPMRSNQYSGYLNISATKALYYWYIESENDPAKDPVVLWLNGGPGCSSLEGLFVEMGPYRTNDFGESVHRNPWTWNRYASIIYMDAPAGVGFSIRTDDQKNWVYTDDEVADDNKKAIGVWFQKFPERKNNPFYVMGESYAGTYVPMLASKLALDPANFPNFVGIAIGNGCIDDVLNLNTLVGFNYNHGFTDEVVYQQSLKKCCSQASLIDGCNFYQMAMDPKNTCYNEASYLSESNFYSGLDPYFLYYSCYLNSADKPQFSTVNQQTAVLRTHLRKKYYNTPEKLDTLPSCTHYNDSTVYLQRDDLRKALMIPDSVPAYESCSDFISNNYDFGKSHYLNQASNIQTLVALNKRVMLFNGDTDSMCNHVHNAEFVANLGIPKIADITTWDDFSELPSSLGMITQYKGLDFLTVRGAGHFVSSSNEKPKEALQLFKNYISNQNYSTPIAEDKPYVAPNNPPTTPGGSSGLVSYFCSCILTVIILFH